MISSFCSGGTCVNVEFAPDGAVHVSGTDLYRPTLVFTREEWAAFLAGAKAGEFDLGDAS